MQRLTIKKALPFIYVIAGIIALICSFIILNDKLHILEDPNYRPSCSINPIISCGSVMQSTQSHLLGFPNPILGLAGFAAVTTLGVTMLAGAQFKRWFWLAVEGGLVLALVFVHWLFIETVYSIGALCPYCIVVWIMTIILFLYTTLHLLREGHIKTPAKLKGVVGFVQKHHGDILALWLLLIAAAILNHFWYYWKTLF
jgi:uncharacterized membrane protein